MEDGFHLVSNEVTNTSVNAPIKVQDEQPPSSLQGPSQKEKLMGLFINSKYAILSGFYNIIHSPPSSLPHFSTSSIYFLGKCYQYYPPQSIFPTFSFNTDFSSLGNSKEFLPEPVGNHQHNDSNEYSQFSDHQHNFNSSNTDLELANVQEFLLDFRSLIYFCYRKDFLPLPGSIPLTTDLGWGCMLRTGQMMLAHVLLRHLLGRGMCKLLPSIIRLFLDWRLNQQDQINPYSSYRQILRWFADAPSSKNPYSIHNIVSNSKIIDDNLSTSKHSINYNSNVNKAGSWFSPTRVCQVIKNLVLEHAPDYLTVHIVKDGVLCRDLVLAQCVQQSPTLNETDSTTTEMTSSALGQASEQYTHQQKAPLPPSPAKLSSPLPPPPPASSQVSNNNNDNNNNNNNSDVHNASTRANNSSCTDSNSVIGSGFTQVGSSSAASAPALKTLSLNLLDENSNNTANPTTSTTLITTTHNTISDSDSGSSLNSSVISISTVSTSSWKPVFILVPLRIGGSDKINPVYVTFVKALLQLPQSVGIMGGRPRQSLYFVGFQDDDVIFLDPHVVRPTLKPDQEFTDESYHCLYPQKMPLAQVDPSLAFGFYCRDRREFEDLCLRLQQLEELPSTNVQDSSAFLTVIENAPSWVLQQAEEDNELGMDDAVLVS